MNVPMVKLNEDHEAVITLSSIKDMDRKKFKMFLDMDNDAFLRCEFEKDKGFILYYMYEDRVPLRQLLSAPMSRHQVLTFLRSLTWAFITARDNGMDPSRIMLGVNSLFWNRQKESVSCIYLPVRADIPVAKPLRIFLKELLVNIMYSDGESMTYLGNIIRYINSRHDLEPESFLSFLNAQEKDEEEMNIPDISVPEREELEIPEMKGQDIQIQADEEGSEDIQAGISGETEPEETKLKMPVLEEIPQTESVETLKVDMLPEDMVSAETKKNILPSENKPEVTAVIIRRSNQEQFVLNEPEVRIGKAPAMTEFCIEDNPAVSRVHAMIDEVNGDYYITDNHSTNHTYVNGSILPEGESRKLGHGDRILLGNEELIFKILSD